MSESSAPAGGGLAGAKRAGARPAELAASLWGSASRAADSSPLHPDDEAALLSWLFERRLGPEAAASPRLASLGLSREARRSLAVDRERCRAAAGTRGEALGRAGEALADAGLSALLYKGEALVRLTHRDPSRRPMADIDLLVPAGSRLAGTRALVDSGFEETPHATALHDVLLARGPGQAAAAALPAGAGHPHGVAIELHGDVFPPPHPFRLDLEGVFERSAPSELRGLRVPSLPDAILLTAFHLLFFEQDGRKGQLALRDLALLADAAGEGAGAEIAVRAARAGLCPLLAALGRRALALGGAPDWLGRLAEEREPIRRRRLALWLTLRELDVSLASEPTRDRALSRRLVAALWEPRVGRTLGALGRGLLGPRGQRGSARVLRRLARHVGAARGKQRGRP